MSPTRLVVLFVGVVLLVAVLCIAALAFQSHGIPAVLQNISVGALTALVGLLVPTGTERVAAPPAQQ